MNIPKRHICLSCEEMTGSRFVTCRNCRRSAKIKKGRQSYKIRRRSTRARRAIIQVTQAVDEVRQAMDGTTQAVDRFNEVAK